MRWFRYKYFNYLLLFAIALISVQDVIDEQCISFSFFSDEMDISVSTIYYIQYSTFVSSATSRIWMQIPLWE